MRYLPNTLTLLRIALTPWLGYLLSTQNWSLAAPVLFVAGITDAIDGFLARKFQWSSRLGSWLDPAADKFLLATVFLSLGYAGIAPLWLVALIFLRDVCILAGVAVLYLRHGITSFPPSIWGKISTVLQILLAAALAFSAPDAPPLRSALIYSTALMTAVSGIHYAFRPRPN